MAENYKHLYEQTKKMLAMYQDELVPGFRKQIEEMESKSKWIPVTERLPEKGEEVLVVDRFGFIEMGFVKETIYGHKYWLGCEGDDVTHWMPLPEPPKEVE